MRIIYLVVNYDSRHVAKQMGCWWDAEKGLWFIPLHFTLRQQNKILDVFEIAIGVDTPIHVPVGAKNIVRDLGAKYNNTSGWYMPYDSSVQEFDTIKEALYNSIPTMFDFLSVKT